jgi:Tetratricopeptide repeat.
MAVETTDLPREIQIALSYLDDVEQQTERLRAQSDSIVARAARAREIQKGDLALAYQELQKLEARGVDVRLARSIVAFQEGNLCWAVACSSGLETSEHTRWTEKAAQLFESSLQDEENGAAYYNLGLCYSLLNRKHSAIQAFRKAEACGSDQLSIDAAKEIRRLDPTGRITAEADARSAQSASVESGYSAAIARKRPNWDLAKTGAGALVLGILTAGFLIGIPIAIIGLGMLLWAFTLGQKYD